MGAPRPTLERPARLTSALSGSARSLSSHLLGQEEPGQDDRPGLQAAVQDQDLQAADRGGRGGRGARQARCPSLNQGNGPTKNAQLNLEKNLNRTIGRAHALRLQNLPISELQNTSFLMDVPLPLQIPSGRAPWFISMSAGT